MPGREGHRGTVATNKGTKRNVKADRRAELTRMKAAQRSAERRRTAVIVGVGIVVALGLIAAVVVPTLTKSAPAKQKIGANTVEHLNTPIKGLLHQVGLIAAQHRTGTIHYDITPPMGGPHNPVWLNCGIYDSPVPNENAVHDLEHGAVWITYQPDLPKGQVDALKSLVRKQNGYMTLSPYPGLPTPIVASAWGYQVHLQKASDPRLAAFVKDYRLGPQTPEPGAACTGGTGTPTG